MMQMGHVIHAGGGPHEGWSRIVTVLEGIIALVVLCALVAGAAAALTFGIVQGAERLTR
jgi:hypothetical protein